MLFRAPRPSHLLVPVAVAATAIALRAQAPAADVPVFSAAAELVVLQVRVVDEDGAFVRGLDREAFRVYEDGQRQPITLFLSEDQPVAAGLVIDGSLSMWQRRPPVLAAMTAFVRSANPRDALFTVGFNERVSFGLPPDVPFTSDSALLHRALERVGARGRTALYDALIAALEHVERSRLPRKVLILVSDGGDNASRAARSAVLDQVRRSGALIYTVGLFERHDRQADPGLLREIARASGGRMFRTHDATRAAEILDEVSTDIRSNYTIGYAPTGARRDGGFRAVRVICDAPEHDGVEVRTRPGYYVEGPT